jgi:hypothetical protein
MVDLAILQSASYIAAALGVVLAAVNYFVTSRREEKRSQQTLDTRQAQMFMNIYQQATSKDFMSAWNLFMSSRWEKYSEYRELLQKKEFANATSILNMFWEGLGVLVKEGFLPIRLVALLSRV